MLGGSGSCRDRVFVAFNKAAIIGGLKVDNPGTGQRNKVSGIENSNGPCLFGTVQT